MPVTIDVLPVAIRDSAVLSAGHIAALCEVDEIPAIDPFFTDDRMKNIVQYYSINPPEMEKELHIYAAELLKENKVREAWQVLLTL